MIVLVCGSRRWRTYGVLGRRLDELPREGLSLVSGGAQGADNDAYFWATTRGVPITVMPAEWDKYGRSAGPIRNRKMLELHPDLVLAFRAKGPSPGTDDMINEAIKRGIPVEVIEERY